MRSDSLNEKLDESHTADSKLNESIASSSLRRRKKKTIDDYEFVVVDENRKIQTSEIGRGAYGTVKKVKDKENGKIYALKIMGKKAIFQSSSKEFIKREIDIQKKIHHPHIIRLYTYFEDEQNVYLVLEFAENGSLFYYIRKKKKLTEKEAFVFFFQTCLGIDYLHKKNFIHRDLKPENLLLDENGNIKICDFGWSAESLNKRQTFCGTIDYMAPEMIKNHPHDHRVDIWCLGIFLYEMVHGNAPYKGKSDHEKTVKISSNSPIDFDASLSPEIIDLIKKILKPNPVERISLLEIFNHPWMKLHERAFGIDIMEYVEQQDQQIKKDQELENTRNPSRRRENTEPGYSNNNKDPSAKIITIQDPTPLMIHHQKSQPEERRPPRSGDISYERYRSVDESLNIDQLLKDYKIDSTPEMDLLRRVEKFTLDRSNRESDQSLNGRSGRQRNMTVPARKQNDDLYSYGEDSHYANSTGLRDNYRRPYEQYSDIYGEHSSLGRARTHNGGVLDSRGPYGKMTKYDSPNDGPSTYHTYHMAHNASFGNRSTKYDKSFRYDDDDDEIQPQRLSRLSKKNSNVEIKKRNRSENKHHKELSFFERILVGLGCMTRESKKDFDLYENW